MSPTSWLPLACKLYVLSLLVLPSTQATGTKPNIVFVLADDYGYNDIGYHQSQIKTPILDKLAASGVKLENYYVQPICSPTRSQLMSGRYQIHTGLQHGVIKPEQANGLPLDDPTLANKMKESGYSTHMVGKWHLGYYKKEYQPWYRGFDTYYGYLNGAEDYFNHTRAYYKDLKHPYLDLRSEKGPDWNQTGKYSGQLFTQRAIEIVKNHTKTKPLFLYLAYQSVHAPLEVPQRYIDLYKHIKNRNRRVYAGMVAAMDEGIGNLTQAMKDAGIWNNTIFIFSNDNGGQIYAGGNNFPLRGWKGSLWEGGFRGVGFVAGGGFSSSNRVNKELIHVSDWFPTLVTLAGGDLNGTKPLDGFDQWKTISEGAPSKRDILLHNIDPLSAKKGKRLYNDTFDNRVRAAIRVGDMKLITGNPGPGRWVRPPGEFDLNFVSENTRQDDDQNIWLFNITADPNEHNDLSQEMPHMVRSLLHQLDILNKTAVPVRYPPFDPNSNPGLHGGVWGPWM